MCAFQGSGHVKGFAGAESLAGLPLVPDERARRKKSPGKTRGPRQLYAGLMLGQADVIG